MATLPRKNDVVNLKKITIDKIFKTINREEICEICAEEICSLLFIFIFCENIFLGYVV